MRHLFGIASLLLCSCFALRAQVANENLTVQLLGGVPLELVWIAPSTFMVGTTEEQKSVMDAMGNTMSDPIRYSPYYELPAHQVTLAQGFYLGKFEVTQAQWEAVMETTPWKSHLSGYEGPDKPAGSVSWFDAQKFMDKLNETTGDTLYRLPTEAEWECACKGGTETLWFTGDDPASVEGYINYFTGYTQSVGSLQPNPFGLYDMGGNVSEWTLDDLGKYEAIPQVDPVGAIPQSGQDRVGIRGGASGDPADEAEELLWKSRCAYRVFGRSGRDDLVHLGFRVLRRGPQVTSVEEASWGQVKGARSGGLGSRQ